MFKIGNTWFILVYWVAKKKKKKNEWKNSEAVIQRCSVKNKSLKISQNSLKNNCAGVSFYWFKVFSCAFFGHLQNFQEHLLCKTSEWVFLKIMFIQISCTITDTICWNNFLTYPPLILLYYLCQILKEKATIF